MIDFDTLVLGPCMGIFGEQIRCRTVALPGEPSVTAFIEGVFDEPNVEQFDLDGFKPGNIINTMPLLGVQMSQFLPYFIQPAQDDVLTRVATGKVYQVAAVREDGLGGAVLELTNASDTLNPP